MAFNKNHQAKIDLMNAFDKANSSMPKNPVMGGNTLPHAPTTGMPRTPAQMASVKKAAAKSAEAREARSRDPNKADLAATPAASAAALKTSAQPGKAAGSLSLAKPKKGLLSL